MVRTVCKHNSLMVFEQDKKGTFIEWLLCAWIYIIHWYPAYDRLALSFLTPPMILSKMYLSIKRLFWSMTNSMTMHFVRRGYMFPIFLFVSLLSFIFLVPKYSYLVTDCSFIITSCLNVSDKLIRAFFKQIELFVSWIIYVSLCQIFCWWIPFILQVFLKCPQMLGCVCIFRKRQQKGIS